MYSLVVFTDVRAASELLGSGRPLALLMRLGSGRLVEIDIGLTDEGGEITPAVREFLPPSSSALILRDRDLPALDERMGRWEYVVHSL